MSKSETLIINMKEKKDFIPALRFDWLTKIYDPLLRVTMPERKFKMALIAQAGLSKNTHVLDFGCGSLTLALMAKRSESAAIVHAVDVDENVLKIATKKREESQQEIFIQKYDGRILPYPSNTFDRVVSSLVFHHLDRDQKMNSLFEILRILRPGGQLHIADWGKPRNALMRAAFITVQLLDGFKTTSDNVEGLLPLYLKKTGFLDVAITQEFQTVFGTLALYKGSKSKPETVL